MAIANAGGNGFFEGSQINMPQSLAAYDPETQAVIAQSERRRRIANLLLQQGLAQGPSTTSTGRFLVARSPVQGLADLAKVAAGAYGNYQADQSENDAVTADQQRMQEGRARIAAALSPQTQGAPLQSSGTPVQGPGQGVMTPEGEQISKDIKLAGVMGGPELASNQERTDFIQRMAPYYQEGPTPQSLAAQQGPERPAPDNSADGKYARLMQVMASSDPRVQAQMQPVLAAVGHQAALDQQQKFQGEQKAMDREARSADTVAKLDQMMMLGLISKDQKDAMLAQNAKIAEMQDATKTKIAKLDVEPSVVVDPSSPTGHALIDARTGKKIGDAPVPASAVKGSQLTPQAQKEIFHADDMVTAAQNAKSALQYVGGLNDNAYGGALADVRASIMSNIPWMKIPEGANNAVAIKNAVTGQALEQLKAAFGGMPTEGERKVLLDVQGSINLPPEQRKEIWDRASQMLDRRIAINQQKADQLRGGTYLKPGGGPSNVPPVNYGTPSAATPAPGGAASGGWSIKPLP